MNTAFSRIALASTSRHGLSFRRSVQFCLAVYVQHSFKRSTLRQSMPIESKCPRRHCGKSSWLHRPWNEKYQAVCVRETCTQASCRKLRRVHATPNYPPSSRYCAGSKHQANSDSNFTKLESRQTPRDAVIAVLHEHTPRTKHSILYFTRGSVFVELERIGKFHYVYHE